MFMNINREECCCFTGHRRIESGHLTLLRQKLQGEITSLAARKGVKAFMAGGALGFDTMAAQAVLWAREKQFPHLKLILALPCREQNARWSQKNSEIYYKILEQADQVIYVSEHYTHSCMFQRNRYMVDHSGYCMCYLQPGKANGGTAYTVKYAQQQGVPVINLADMQEEPEPWDEIDPYYFTL